MPFKLSTSPQVLLLKLTFLKHEPCYRHFCVSTDFEFFFFSHGRDLILNKLKQRHESFSVQT